MPSRRNREAMARLGLRELRRHGPHDGAACTRIVQRNSRGGVVAGTRGVPPVGVEPTLGTLLGGRPLPLGYGGWVMIPRPVRDHSCSGEWGEKNSLRFTYSIHAPRSANAKRYQFALLWMNCAHSVAGRWRC